jgi:hypothetical protein
MASKKMLSPKTTIWWVPAAGLANYLAPTAAEINAGTNISCAIVTGYTLNPTDSDTDSTKSICDNSNTANPTFDNYEANLTFFRSVIADATGVYYTAFNLFKTEGANGYLVRRIGKDNAAVAAIGDTVSVFGVESDVPTDTESDAGGPIQLGVTFLPQGKMKINYTIAA